MFLAKPQNFGLALRMRRGSPLGFHECSTLLVRSLVLAPAGEERDVRRRHAKAMSAASGLNSMAAHDSTTVRAGTHG